MMKVIQQQNKTISIMETLELTEQQTVAPTVKQNISSATESIKFVLAFVSILISLNCIAQKNVVVKYYDSLWFTTPKEKAMYVAEFEKNDTLYKCTGYYLSSKKIYSKSYCTDINYNLPIGKLLTYYESGKLKDSAFYDTKGKKSFSISYYESGKGKEITNYSDWGAYETHTFYENGKLWAHCLQKKPPAQYQCEAFDENGNVLPNYIYKKPPEFQGGQTMWSRYLERNLDISVTTKNSAPAGYYRVYVSFVVEKDGTLINIMAENDPGYGTKEEAIRVITKASKWLPAIQYNQPVRYPSRQVITFVVN